MFNYFNRKHLMNHIIHILRIDYGMHTYPDLSFKYTLDDNVLTLVLPSKDQYIFSPFKEDLTITYNKVTETIQLSNDDFNLASDKSLLKHLRKCFTFLEKRNEFNDKVYSDRLKMSQYIDPRHRNDSSGKRNKDGSIYRDFLYAGSDVSNDSSGNDSSNDHHNNNHNDN